MGGLAQAVEQQTRESPEEAGLRGDDGGQPQQTQQGIFPSFPLFNLSVDSTRFGGI